MADYDQIMKALRNAHAAGDTAAATRLAAMAKAAKAQPAQAQPAAEPQGADFLSRDALVAAGRDPVGAAAAIKSAQSQRMNEQLQAGTYAPTPRQPMGVGEALLQGANQGVTYGFGDEAVARIMSMDPNITYEQALQQVRGSLEAARNDQPVAAYGGEIGGALIAPGAGLAGRAVTAAPGTVARVATGVATGAAQGALYGAGAAEEGGRLQGAGYGAAVGGAVGGVVPLAARGVERMVGNRAVNQAISQAQTPAQIRATASQLYDSVDGAVMPRAGLAPAAQGAIDDATAMAMDPMLTPSASRVADKLADAATSPDPNIAFRELDVLRRQSAIPAGNFSSAPGAATERAIGTRFIEAIDDFIDQADPAVSGALKEARDMWGRLRRIEKVEGAIERARLAASGFENGLRNEFRALLRNPKALRGYSKSEIDAIRRVASGTTAGNLMRQIGRVGLNFGGASNGFGAAMAGIGSTAVGGPLAGALTVGAGTAAKKLAERSTVKAAERALGIIAARPQIAQLPAAQLPQLAVNALAAPQSVAAPVYNALVGLPR